MIGKIVGKATAKTLGVDTKSFRGIGMILLQILRVFTTIGLASAIAASVVLVAKVDIGTDYWFFEAVSSSFTILLCISLIVTELPLLKGWIRKQWPAFSDASGLGWIGLAKIIIGCNILGKLTNPYTAQDEIGMPMWRLILAAGLLNIIFGFFNVIITIVYSDRKNGINARHIRSKGTLAKGIDEKDILPSYHSDISASSIRKEKHRSRFVSVFSQDGASMRQQKGASKFVNMFWNKGSETVKDILRPKESTPEPKYVRPSISAPISHHTSALENGHGDGHLERSPIDPTVIRPDSVYHPMYQNRASSRYSEAAMSRF